MVNLIMQNKGYYRLVTLKINVYEIKCKKKMGMSLLVSSPPLWPTEGGPL